MFLVISHHFAAFLGPMFSLSGNIIGSPFLVYQRVISSTRKPIRGVGLKKAIRVGGSFLQRS